MKITVVLAILSILLLAGCGTTTEPTPTEDNAMLLNSNSVVTSEVVEKTETKMAHEVVTVKIINNKVDPEVIKVAAGTELELVFNVDRDLVLAFPELGHEEKVVTGSNAIMTFNIKDAGEYEIICKSGCDVPLLGTIIAA